MKFKYWTVDRTQVNYYITSSFSRSFVINSGTFMQEMIKRHGRITHLPRTNRIRRLTQCEHVIIRLRKTKQTGHMIETVIVAGVFPPVAENSIEYSIESYSTLKIFVSVINTLLIPPPPFPHVISMVESWVLNHM